MAMYVKTCWKERSNFVVLSNNYCSYFVEIKYCDKNFGLFSNHKKDIQLYIKLLDRFNARKISIRSCVLHIDKFFFNIFVRYSQEENIM